MRFRGLAILVSLSFALLAASCGGGSGRSGTDVEVTGTGPAGATTAGEVAVFTMTVANTGENTANDVVITNLVGNQLVPAGITCTAAGGATCPDTSSVSMSVPSLPPGGRLTFEVSATLTQTATGTITNTMSATYEDDVDRGNNSVTVTASAYSTNLSVSATAPSGTVPGGAVATFSMVVTNEGPADAQDVAVTNTVGEGLTLGTISCAAAGDAVCPATTGASMTVPSLPVGGTLTFTVPATVIAGTNGLAKNTMSVEVAGDSKSFDDSATAAVSVASSDLGVSLTGPATVGAGGTAVFTAVVANAGQGPATSLVLNTTLSAGYSAQITCAPSTGATCPAAPLGGTINVPVLDRGRWLTFTIEVAVPKAARGDLVAAVALSAAGGDPDATNNSASVTAVAVDPASGAYKAFAADGRSYDLSIDFDALKATFSGNGKTWERSFSAKDSVGDFVIAGTSRLRVATDLVVGGHDFGEGVVPFIAARNFATSLLQAVGTYNLATRDLPAAGGAPVTHAGTAQISDNTLFICQSDTKVSRPSSCDAAAVKSYTLQVDATTGTFTGTSVDASHTKYMFRVGRSGASTVLLSVGEPSADGPRQLRIGLPESSTLAGGQQFGATTGGDWVSMTLTPSSFATNGVQGSNDTASLQTVSSGGPFAMRTGLRTSDSARIYVLQALPIAVMVGDFGGAASGTLEIAVP